MTGILCAVEEVLRLSAGWFHFPWLLKVEGSFVLCLFFGLVCFFCLPCLLVLSLLALFCCFFFGSFLNFLKRSHTSCDLLAKR